MSRLTFHDLPGRLSRRAAKVGRGVRALVRTPVLAATNLVSGARWSTRRTRPSSP